MPCGKILAIFNGVNDLLFACNYNSRPHLRSSPYYTTLISLVPRREIIVKRVRRHTYLALRDSSAKSERAKQPLAPVAPILHIHLLRRVLPHVPHALRVSIPSQAHERAQEPKEVAAGTEL